MRQRETSDKRNIKKILSLTAIGAAVIAVGAAVTVPLFSLSRGAYLFLSALMTLALTPIIIDSPLPLPAAVCLSLVSLILPLPTAVLILLFYRPRRTVRETRAREIEAGLSGELESLASVEYLCDGREAFLKICEDLSGARENIYIEAYTVAEGEAFFKICEILKKKAKDGVRVKLKYDLIGSAYRLSRGFIRELKGCGIEVSAHSSISRPNCRDHRKLIAVDGRILYVSGFNIADEYFELCGGVWRDAALRLTGEELYPFSTCVSKKSPIQKRDTGRSARLILSLPSYPAESIFLRELNRIFFSAEKSISILTPYLSPDPDTEAALAFASRCGVRVRIALPRVSDSALSGAVTAAHAQRLLGAGCEIYYYGEGFLHSKVYLIDEMRAAVGSANLDMRSGYSNLESLIILHGWECIEKIKEDTEKVFSVSERAEPATSVGGLCRLGQAMLSALTPLI